MGVFTAAHFLHALTFMQHRNKSDQTNQRAIERSNERISTKTKTRCYIGEYTVTTWFYKGIIVYRALVSYAHLAWTSINSQNRQTRFPQ